MLIRFNLQNVLVRRLFLFISLVILALLVKVMTGEFVVGTLSDERVRANKDLLNTAAGYFPDSARLPARLAQIETAETKPDLESAERNLERAVKLSPNNYKYRLLLAEIRDRRGNGDGAEQTFNDALLLAPNYSEIHWKMANFLIRENRIEESVEHFRIAAGANPSLFGATLDLVSAVADENPVLLDRIVENNQKGMLKLALLTANQSRMPKAAEIFSKIDKKISLPAWESSSFFDLLINRGFSKLAFDLWIQLKTGEGEIVDRSPVWNGGFETESDHLAQFDWRIGKSDYARIGLDSSESRSGRRSLLIYFSGRDTVKLDNEVKHLLALKPGTDYRLEYYVKTEELKTSEGPRIVISDTKGNRIAQSEPVAAGTSDWNRITINFTAPEKTTGDAAALYISVKRQPRYSYDQPMHGRIWFDDFVIDEVNGK